jgi:predicted Zn-dependent protease
VSVARDLLDGRVTLGELRGYHPSAIAALCHDALALHENGRTDEAMVMLRGLRALEPANVQVLRLLGLILTERGAHREALGYLDDALRASPSDARLRVARARIRLQLGDGRGAGADLRIACDQADGPGGQHAALFLKKIMAEAATPRPL